MRSAILVLGLCLAGCGAGSDPGIEVAGVERLRSRIAAARGRPLLVNFWATWCQPCLQEIPDLAALHASGDVRVLGVSLDAFLAGQDRAAAVVDTFLARTPAPYEHFVFVGSQDDVLVGFDVPGNIPYSILYDARGNVLDRIEGRVSLQAVRARLASR